MSIRSTVAEGRDSCSVSLIEGRGYCTGGKVTSGCPMSYVRTLGVTSINALPLKIRFANFLWECYRKAGMDHVPLKLLSFGPSRYGIPEGGGVAMARNTTNYLTTVKGEI